MVVRARTTRGGGGSSGGGVASGGSDAAAAAERPARRAGRRRPRAAAARARRGPAPDFGPNVLIFDPSMSMSSIQSQLDAVYAQMDADQFDNLGLRVPLQARAIQPRRPGRVLHARASGSGCRRTTWSSRAPCGRRPTGSGSNNATCNFWRTAREPRRRPDRRPSTTGTDVWATSQGTALRRIHVKGIIVARRQRRLGERRVHRRLEDRHADQLRHAAAIPDAKRRPHELARVELEHGLRRRRPAPFGHLAAPAVHGRRRHAGRAREAVPLHRRERKLPRHGPGAEDEQPRLELGNEPAASPAPPGSPLSIDRFYIAKPGVDTAATINAALAQGKHLLLTPGDYQLRQPDSGHASRGRSSSGIGLPVLIPDERQRAS